MLDKKKDMALPFECKKKPNKKQVINKSESWDEDLKMNWE